MTPKSKNSLTITILSLLCIIAFCAGLTWLGVLLLIAAVAVYFLPTHLSPKRLKMKAKGESRETYVDLCDFHKRDLFDEDIAERAAERFVVIDFETTGLDRAYDRIVEISARRYENGVCTKSFESLVNPGRDIPAEATAIHHITNHMVRRAPIESVAIQKLHEFLGDDLIAAHNADFDMTFLHNAYFREGLEAHNDYIDTLAVARKIYSLSNYKLGTIGEYLEMSTDNLHRAGSDTEICGEIVVDALRKIRRTSILDDVVGECSALDREYLRAIDKIFTEGEISPARISVTRTKTYLEIKYADNDFLRIKTTGSTPYLLLKAPASVIKKLTDDQFVTVPAPASDGAGHHRIIISSPEDIPALGKLICSICPE